MSTSETRNEVVALHKRGLSNGQIAKSLGIVRGTVGGHLYRWRRGETPTGRPSSWSQEAVATMVQMHATGATSREIGAVIGKTPGAVRKHGARMGLSWIDRVPRSGLRFTLPNLTDKQIEAAQRDGDQKMVRALALAFARGDHIREAMKAAA